MPSTDMGDMADTEGDGMDIMVGTQGVDTMVVGVDTMVAAEVDTMVVTRDMVVGHMDAKSCATVLKLY